MVLVDQNQLTTIDQSILFKPVNEVNLAGRNIPHKKLHAIT